MQASGFWAFVSSFKQYARDQELCVKGQVTGPFSFGLTVTDEFNRPIIYHQAYYEAVVTALSLHAAWQAARLKELHPHVLMLIDEPYLASYGSALVSVDRDLVVRSINEVINRIHEAGALAGLHCCGNTDWSLLLGTKADIINFDAWGYFERFALYPEAVEDFLSRGGVLAWGIVPTLEFTGEETVEDLIVKLENGIRKLASKKVSEEFLRQRSLLTSSCGMGLMTVENSKKAMELLAELSKRMREKYF